MKLYEKTFYNHQTLPVKNISKSIRLDTFKKLSKWYASRLGKYLPDRKGLCLDLPCGSGNFLYFLHDQGYHNVIGYDLDLNQVELAQDFKLPAFEGDAFNVLADETKSYDCISSLDFIEHISKDQSLTFLSMCYERLKPGGVFILRTPCADSPFGVRDIFNDITHQWGMTSNVLRIILGMCGFGKVEILDEKPQPYKFINILRLLAFYLTRPIFTVFCIALGVKAPSIWSSSMWGIAYKPKL